MTALVFFLLFSQPFQQHFSGVGRVDDRNHRNDKIKELCSIFSLKQIITNSINKDNRFLRYGITIVQKGIEFAQTYKDIWLIQSIQILEKYNTVFRHFKEIDNFIQMPVKYGI